MYRNNIVLISMTKQTIQSQYGIFDLSRVMYEILKTTLQLRSKYVYVKVIRFGGIKGNCTKLVLRQWIHSTQKELIHFLLISFVLKNLVEVLNLIYIPHLKHATRCAYKASHHWTVNWQVASTDWLGKPNDISRDVRRKKERHRRNPSRKTARGNKF